MNFNITPADAQEVLDAIIELDRNRVEIMLVRSNLYGDRKKTPWWCKLEIDAKPHDTQGARRELRIDSSYHDNPLDAFMDAYRTFSGLTEGNAWKAAITRANTPLLEQKADEPDF